MATAAIKPQVDVVSRQTEALPPLASSMALPYRDAMSRRVMLPAVFAALFLTICLPGGIRPFARADEPPPVAEAASEWVTLAPGLDLITLEHRDGDLVKIAVLRFDPDRYEFTLFSSAWNGQPGRGITQWADSEELVAAINAGMYLPDGSTNTGYMRQGEQHNNARVAERYGAFFVAGPRRPGLPSAAVLDRARDDWKTLLPQYATVVQNFRLLGPNGDQVWPENGPLHAVAAVGQDKEGRILFMHSRAQVGVHRFVRALLEAPGLDLVSAMYVEGGSQAAMVLRLPKIRATWSAMPALPLLSDPPLPNILGVRARGAGANPE